jgi:hypothetical protein
VVVTAGLCGWSKQVFVVVKAGLCGWSKQVSVAGLQPKVKLSAITQPLTHQTSYAPVRHMAVCMVLSQDNINMASEPPPALHRHYQSHPHQQAYHVLRPSAASALASVLCSSAACQRQAPTLLRLLLLAPVPTPPQLASTLTDRQTSTMTQSTTPNCHS